MSNINHEISPVDVIPHLSLDIFKDNPNSRFATGLIGRGTDFSEGNEDVANAYFELRGNVYIGQTRMLSPDTEGKKESDADDERSTHFAVLENMGTYQRLVATMRIIHGGVMGKLPIEKFFPEIPYSTNSSGSAIEISRYICRHEDLRLQNALKWQLYPAALAYVMHERLGPTYAVVEPPLERSLIKSGVPIERIADPKYIPEYNDVNLGILIDTQRLAENIETVSPGAISGIDLNRFNFIGDYEGF